MPAGLYNIVDVKNGADWFLYLNFQESDGTPTNLANCTMKMQVKADYATAAVATLSTATGGITINSAANGTATATLTAAQTANITAGNYIYDLKLTNSAGVADFEVEGGFTVAGSVTS